MYHNDRCIIYYLSTHFMLQYISYCASVILYIVLYLYILNLFIRYILYLYFKIFYILKYIYLYYRYICTEPIL